MTALTLEQFAPGDPSGILRMKDRIHSTAQHAEDTQQELKALLDRGSEIPWEGEHARAFERQVESLPRDLGLVASSYFKAAHALRLYAERLDDLQGQVRAAIARANDAERRRDVALRARDAANARISSLQAQLRAASQQVAVANASAPDTSTPEGAAAAQAAADAAAAAQRRVDELNRQLSAATAERNRQAALAAKADDELRRELRRLDSLRDEREDAVRRCAAMLHESVEEALRERSWFESAADFLGDAARLVGTGPTAWFTPFGGISTGLFAGAVLLSQTIADGALSVLELGVRGGGQAWRSGWGFLRTDVGIHAPFLKGVSGFFSASVAVIGGATAAGEQFIIDGNRPMGERTARAAGAGVAVGGFDFLVTKGFVTGGAALGTAVIPIPVVGTVVGGALGFAAGEAVKWVAGDTVQRIGAATGEAIWDVGSGVVRGAQDVGSALAGGARDVTEAAGDVLDGASDVVGNVASKLKFW